MLFLSGSYRSPWRTGTTWKKRDSWTSCEFSLFNNCIIQTPYQMQCTFLLPIYSGTTFQSVCLNMHFLLKGNPGRKGIPGQNGENGEPVSHTNCSNLYILLC